MEHNLTGSFASFQIQQFLAPGRIADIYLARDDGGRLVVLKALRSAYVGDAAQTRRLFLEGEILSSIYGAQSHPSIPRCVQMGREAKTGNPFLALTYAEGQPLRSLLEAGRRFTLSDIAAVGKAVCDALEAVHKSGFCHHGISADNLIVASDGTRISGVTLVGFGAACLENTQSDVAASSPLTMSPEECRGEPVTSASDLYAVGIVLYEMTVGHPPFTSRTDNPSEIMEMHRSADPQIPPGVEEPLRSILLALLSKDPAQRPFAAEQLKANSGGNLGIQLSPFTASQAVYPLTADESSGSRLGWELSSSATLERLLSPAEVQLSEPEKLLKQPLEERLDFPIRQIPEIPALGESGPRTPSNDPMRKEPSDDDFRVREVFPSETLLREAVRDDIPLDELGLPVIESGLLKEPLTREPSEPERGSEKWSVRREETKEELSALQEALVGPGAIQDLDSQNKNVVLPIVPISPPPPRKSRRGLIMLALSGLGALGILLVSLGVMFFRHPSPHPIPPIHNGNGGNVVIPPITKVKVDVCTISHQLPNEYCPKGTIQNQEFIKGQEPTQVCTVHHKPKTVPPPQYVVKRICTISGKVANQYCPKGTVKPEQFVKGQEPKEICAIHHKLPPVVQKVWVRICTTSGGVANRYCPISTVRREEFTKGQQPTARCTVHRKPDKPKIEYVTIKVCPVGSERYAASARFCTEAAHKQNGQYPRLVSKKVPK